MEATSQPWKEWEASTKEVINNHERGEAVQYVVPPRAVAGDQTYVLFALDGPFRLTSFSKDGRRFAIFERVDTALAQLPPAANEGVTPAPAPSGRPPPAALPSEPQAPQALDTGAAGSSPASGDAAVAAATARGADKPDGPPAPSGTTPCTSSVAGGEGHSTVVGAGGGLLLAADMTLMLTERPGASLVVGPCYANVHEGSLAMQTGSYAIGLSEIFTVDFAAARHLDKRREEAAAMEAAFLQELALEDQKTQPKKSKKKKSKKKKAQAQDALQAARVEEWDPVPEESDAATSSIATKPPADTAATHISASPTGADTDSQSESEAEGDNDEDSGSLLPPTPSPQRSSGKTVKAGVTGTESVSVSTTGWSEVTTRRGRGRGGKGSRDEDDECPAAGQHAAEGAAAARSDDADLDDWHSGGGEVGESSGKKSRGRRGGRRRRRAGRDSKDQQEPQTPFQADDGGGAGGAARRVSDGGVILPRASSGGSAWGAHGIVRACSPPAAGRQAAAAYTAPGLAPSSSWCGTAAQQRDPSSTFATAAAAFAATAAAPAPAQASLTSTKPAPHEEHVEPNWGALRLGNGLFDPSSGFAGQNLAVTPPEAALMTSVAQFVLDD